MSEEIRYELEVVKWEGKIHCAYLNNFRIAGGKPWAGGQTVKKWSVTARDVIQSIPELQTLSKNFDAAQSELAALREELATMHREFEIGQQNWVEGMKSLTAAEQRNSELTQALERGKMWVGQYRAWYGDSGVVAEDHLMIIRTLKGLPHPPTEFDKPTESGASE